MAALLLMILPEKSDAEEKTKKAIVSVTFDDATLTQFTYGLPLARKYDIPGTLYVSTQPIGEDKWNMTWDNVLAFKAAGWEIGGHSHTHVDFTSVADTVVVEELRGSTAILFDKLGELPVSFAVPFGEYDAKIIQHVAHVYESSVAAWGIEEGNLNVIGKTNPYEISRFGVKSSHTGDQLCDATKRAVDNGTWLVFAFHGIVDGSPSEYQSSVKTFEALLSCISEFRTAGKLDVMVTKEALMHARKRGDGGITTTELKGNRKNVVK